MWTTTPPALTGLRGSHDGSFEAAHDLRDGRSRIRGTATDTGEDYDLVVVGGGISGLAAAYFFRKAEGPDSKILILDNHEDFGGHATRNEFRSGGRTLLMNGGTIIIQDFDWYDEASQGLIRELGIDVEALPGVRGRGVVRVAWPEPGCLLRQGDLRSGSTGDGAA